MPMTKEKMIAAWRKRTPKPDRSTWHQLSDRVPANTLHQRACADRGRRSEWSFRRQVWTSALLKIGDARSGVRSSLCDVKVKPAL